MKKKNDKKDDNASSKKKSKTSKKDIKSRDMKKKETSSSDEIKSFNKKENNRKEKVSSQKNSKKQIHEFLDQLIQPLNGTQIYKQDASNKDSKVSTTSKEKDNSELLFKVDKKTSKLTPKGILWAALDAYYKIGNDIDKFELFVKDLLQSLSLLATGGADIEVFGKDFNDFFELVVNMINMTGKMKEILDQNGIEFDVKKYLAGEACIDDEDDAEENGSNNGKPKKSK